MKFILAAPLLLSMSLDAVGAHVLDGDLNEQTVPVMTEPVSAQNQSNQIHTEYSKLRILVTSSGGKIMQTFEGIVQVGNRLLRVQVQAANQLEP